MLAACTWPAPTSRLNQPHLRGLAWWPDRPVVLPHWTPDAGARCCEDELAFQQHAAPSRRAALPRRADPRRPVPRQRDVRRTAGRGPLSGFFDFYFAGTTPGLFDAAVCLNDWCMRPRQPPPPRPAPAPSCRLPGVRPSPAERRLPGHAARRRRFRFWLSRLWDWHLPRDARCSNRTTRALRAHAARARRRPGIPLQAEPALAVKSVRPGGCMGARRAWRLYLSAGAAGLHRPVLVF